MNFSDDSVIVMTAKAKKVRELKRISHAQPSVFRINSFSRRISLAWNQALKGGGGGGVYSNAKFCYLNIRHPMHRGGGFNFN